MADEQDTAAGTPRRVVIVGGGIAGLEALLALNDLAGDRVQITLVASEPDFTYKPLAVEEPFTLQPAQRRALEPAARDMGAEFVQGAVAAVRPDEHSVEISDGSRLDYDDIIVCVGARQLPAFGEAITFRLTGEPLGIEDLVPKNGSDGQRVALVVPPGVSWALPIYELALMARNRADEIGRRDLEYVVVTPEAAPLALFGSGPSDAVAEILRARNIEIETGAYVHEDDRGRLIVTPGDRVLEAARVIALPTLEGPRIEGLPADEHGFIPIDEHARVTGVEDAYAAGDGTTFPIKHGGLATQQADAAAEHIAARAGAPVQPEPFRPVLRGQLITGDESLQMRHELTGGAGEGEAGLDYLWWPPHKVSGRYLAPWLGETTPHRDPAPTSHPIDVEISLPEEWHSEPMALDPYGTERLD